jgi:hypothetical protein
LCGVGDEVIDFPLVLGRLRRLGGTAVPRSFVPALVRTFKKTPERAVFLVEVSPTLGEGADAGDSGGGGAAAPVRCVMKVRRARSLVDRVRFLLRLSPLDREVFGAQMLAAMGVATAEPLAIGVARGSVGALQCVLTAVVDGDSLLELIAARGRGVRREHEIADAVGVQVAHFFACGVYNRDHKPSNLIVTGGVDGDGVPVIAVIDAAGVRRGKKPKSMLASLVIEPLGCGCLPRRALMMRALRAYMGGVLAGMEAEAESGMARGVERAAVKDLWRAVARMVAEHGDPTPRDNPLGS